MEKELVIESLIQEIRSEKRKNAQKGDLKKEILNRGHDKRTIDNIFGYIYKTSLDDELVLELVSAERYYKEFVKSEEYASIMNARLRERKKKQRIDLLLFIIFIYPVLGIPFIVKLAAVYGLSGITGGASISVIIGVWFCIVYIYTGSKGKER